MVKKYFVANFGEERILLLGIKCYDTFVFECYNSSVNFTDLPEPSHGNTWIQCCSKKAPNQLLELCSNGCGAIAKNLQDTCIYHSFIRVKSFLLALWMWVDIILDGVTTHTYYEMAYNPNSTYIQWALNFQKKSNSTKLETVSEGYFFCAILTWILPPLSSALVCGIYKRSKLWSNLWYLFTHAENRWCKIILIFLCPFLVPILGLGMFGCIFLFGIVFVYIYVPVAAMCLGLEILWKGPEEEEYEKSCQDGYKCLATYWLPVLKLSEIIFEAVPQFTLALVFSINNYQYLRDHDVIFLLPTTVYSMIFSVGSIVLGITTGIYRGKELGGDFFHVTSS